MVGVLGSIIGPFALPIYQRACKILASFIDAVRADNDQLYPQSSRMVRSIDLISAVFLALGEQSQALIVQSDIIQSVNSLVEMNDNQVRKYAFGLLGDMAKCAGPLIAPFMNGYIQAAIASLKLEQGFDS